ncbi:MAG: hypothetical protein PHC51_09010 [bacterium]|nr:hypothetical protein [bacterium]
MITPTIDPDDFENYQGTDYLGYWLHVYCESYRQLRVGSCKAMLQDIRTLINIIRDAGASGISVDDLIESYLTITPRQERGFPENFSAGALDILIKMGMADNSSGNLRILANGEFFVSPHANFSPMQ